MNISELEQKARRHRRQIIEMVYEGGAGHIGGALSVIDLMTYTYARYVDFTQSERAKVVLSKGHVTPALYAILYEQGIIEREEFKTFRNVDSRLQGHPSVKCLPEVDATTGMLGQGLSIALGMAMAKRLKGFEEKVFAIIGDGELHEGQIWEALSQASHMKASNLYALVDLNGLSSHDPVASVNNIEPIDERFKAFGWDIFELEDGNDMTQIHQAYEYFELNPSDKPKALLARTVKGKGVSYMENDGDWHSKCPSAEQFEIAMKELEG
ncbi:transketolase [Vibrio ponticus]|uniref:Transketolase n=1 Tax=Vibrio ponticus TaxID=265668 RepID=A0A3N3E0U5_9VIBR|nr:transketolase [Vibrio ponticus]ROV60367.1 transketolase [Vibrio ponticus]